MLLLLFLACFTYVGTSGAGGSASRFSKIEMRMTWNNALKNCTSSGGTLASIKTKADQDEVASLATTDPGYWIGLRAELANEPFLWYGDNSSVTAFTKWGPGQPDYQSLKAGPGPFCVRVFLRGVWDDIFCNGTIEGAICETTTRTSAPETSSTTSRQAATTQVMTTQTSQQVAVNSRDALPGTITPCPCSSMNYATVAAERTPQVAPGLKLLMPTTDTLGTPRETMGAIMQRCHDFDANRYAPPSVLPNHPVPIGIAFEVLSLIEIHNVAQTISVTGRLLSIWEVDTCPWNSSTVVSERPYEEVQLASPDAIWQPHVRFLSAANANIYMENTAIGDDFLVIMESLPPKANRKFSFYWTREGPFTSFCALDLTMFPFDQQKCSFEFALKRKVTLISYTPNTTHFYCDKKVAANTEWELVKTSASIASKMLGGSTVSTVSFTVTLQRLSNYYIENLYIPCAVLGVLELGSFMIPPNEPARPAFSVTIVLSMTVAQTAVLEHVPKKPTTNLLSAYVQRMAWFSAGCTCYELLALLLCTLKIMPKMMGRKVRLVRILDGIAFLLALGAATAVNYLFAKYMF